MSAGIDNYYTARALLCQIDVLADSLGRLRRRTPDEYLLERATGALDAIDAMLRPTAAELVAAGQTPVQALVEVDTHVRRLRLVLCEPTR